MSDETIIRAWRILADHGAILEAVEEQNHDGLLTGLVLHLKGVGHLTDEQLLRLVGLNEEHSNDSL